MKTIGKIASLGNLKGAGMEFSLSRSFSKLIFSKIFSFLILQNKQASKPIDAQIMNTDSQFNALINNGESEYIKTADIEDALVIRTTE